MENSDFKYFLATNSAEGFVSSFAESYDPKNGWRAYIIKGGPGTGKSSFMKFLNSKAKEKGLKSELFPCSSDPESLDAVSFPEIKTIIMDGTAPHTVDPVYPAVCEEILNFGDFWDTTKLKTNTEVLSLTDKNKAFHKSASRYLRATGQLLSDNFKIADIATDKDKASAFGAKLAKKYISKSKNSKSKEWVRYLCGVTPRGIVSYGQDLPEIYKTIIIKDEYGSASNTVLSKVREYALKKNHEIISIKNSFLPSLAIDGVIIPELSLAFLRESEYLKFSPDSRRIHARRFTNNAILSKSRERLKFNKKAAKSLLLTAVDILKQAKSTHDELEKHYVSAMDFNKLNDFAESFAQKLFN